MRRSIRKILLFGLIIFLLMQLYQPDRNSDNGQVLSRHISKVYPMPQNVSAIFQESCYDCHSNNTHYPWYSYMQPVRLWMEQHIMDGKKDLNFSEFGNYSKRKQESKFKSMIKQVQSGEMPLDSYTMIHKNAKLSDEKKKVLIGWIKKIQDSLSTDY